MVLYSRSSAADGAHRDPITGLEESVKRLGLGRKGEDCAYPERPGEQDCSYFIRTGSCAYGSRCRYNHPRHREAVSNAQLGRLGYPERVGQPACEYFLKTGKCKYGSVCKYHHPRQGVGSVSLNNYGYPLRQGEKECSYFVKTGQCKFGSACRFHHPPPVSSTIPSPAAVYPVVQSALVPSPQQYPSLGSWQVGGPSISPTCYVPGSYGPVVISPSIVPGPGWNPYLTSVSPAMSPDGQQITQAGLPYGLPYQSSPSTLLHPGPYPFITALSGPSNTLQKESKLPERPGQPICQHYLKMGMCKFGTMCKYHHPPAGHAPYSNCSYSPLGLPLRPGVQPCPDYTQHGVCKFGQTCKYDHPVGTLGYSPSVPSLSDIPIAPYPVGYSMTTLRPSASYLDLQPFFIVPRKENVIIEELT